MSILACNLTLLAVVLAFLLAGALRQVPVYEAFIEGAKQGFEVARDLLPYLVAMLCAIGLLRASGALDFALDGIRYLFTWLGTDTRFVDALPTAFAKPYSASAAHRRLLRVFRLTSQGRDGLPRTFANGSYRTASAFEARSKPRNLLAQRAHLRHQRLFGVGHGGFDRRAALGVDL